MVSKFSAAKWIGFVTAVWVQAVAGSNYTFSNYSSALKSIMVLTQLQLNNLSVAKDVGKAFGIISGLASDRLPVSVILVIGAIEGLIGYGAQWLVVSQRITPLPYWQMCIFLCIGGNSTTWMNTAVLVTCMRNFRSNQGKTSGILKGYLGLSTAIFTDLSTALFSGDPSALLLLLVIIPGLFCLVCAFFLHEIPPSEEDKQESHIFSFFNITAVILAFYLLAFNIIGKQGRVLSLVFAFGLIMLLITPVLVPLYLKFSKSKPNSDLDFTDPFLIRDVKEDIQIQTVNVDYVMEVKHYRTIGEEHTIYEMLCSFDFWVLFVTFLCGVGTGICVINNLGQMGGALGYQDVSIFISLTSIWGFFGRIISGMTSDYCIGKYATPRPIWNALSQILMAIGLIAIAIAFPGSLYIGSSIVGFSYGVRLAVTVPVASEMFGLKYYGLLYNILILNLPLGSFLFSGLLAGYLYDAQATTTIDGGNTCSGPHCYRLVFVIMAFCCVVGFSLDMLLAIRTRKLYLKLFEMKKCKETM